MHRRCAFLATVVSATVILTSTCGVPLKPAPLNEDAAAADEIIRLEHRFAEAALADDFESVAGLLAPEFTGVDPGGRELSRSQVLEQQKDPDRLIETLRHDNIRVRVYGDCAVVFGVTVMSGKYKDTAFSGEFPYMRVWIKRQGRWLAVATQSSSGTRQRLPE